MSRHSRQSLLISLPAGLDGKENDGDGLKSMFAKTKTKRRKSSSAGLRAHHENKVRALPMEDDPNRPGSPGGSPQPPPPPPPPPPPADSPPPPPPPADTPPPPPPPPADDEVVQGTSPTANLIKGFVDLSVDGSGGSAAAASSAARKPSRRVSASPAASASGTPAPVVAYEDTAADIAVSAGAFASISPSSGSSSSSTAYTDPSGAAWLLRRAVHSVDAEMHGAIWPPLRRALLEIVELQASWSDGDHVSKDKSRQVRFHHANGSHLEPPAWGKDPPPESEEAQHRLRIVARLAGVVRAQNEWIRLHAAPTADAAFQQQQQRASRRTRPACLADLGGDSPSPAKPPRPSASLAAFDGGVAPIGFPFSPATPAAAVGTPQAPPSPALLPPAASLIASLRSALHGARAEAEALLLGSTFTTTGKASAGRGKASAKEKATEKAQAERERARARAATAVLDSELSALAHGLPMMRSLLSSQLSSSIRQQLRRNLDQDRSRNRSLLADLPRGRGIGFLAKCDSAAKVLSCALYEARQLGPMLREPTLRGLLAMDPRDARDILAELPQPILDDLLTLHEAHAALRHLLCATDIRSPPVPRQDEPGWEDLCRLLAFAREAGCEDEVHFLPLEELKPLRAVLLAQQNGVPSLAKLLSFQSPQHPLNQRTRAKASTTPSLYASDSAAALAEALAPA